MFVTLFAAGLLIHQFMYLIMYPGYVTTNFAPALGLRVPKPLFVALQVAGPLLVVILIALDEKIAFVFALAVYLLWTSIQSLRISNHIWLGFLGISVVLFADPLEQVTEARLLLGALYLISGLMKCNYQFLFSDESVSKLIIRLQAENGNWSAPKWLLTFSPFLVAAGEIASGLMVLSDTMILLAFLICIAMHFAFGFVGNVHFSMFALSFWSLLLGCSFQGVDALLDIWPLLAVAAIFGALSSYLLKANLRDLADPSSKAGIYGSALLSGLYCPTAIVVWVSIPATLPSGTWGIGAWVVSTALTVNFLLLLLGIKSEWSYAMFSNVRPYGQAGVFGYIPRWKAPYYTVRWDGHPSDKALSAMPEHIRPQLLSETHYFSGPVAREFLRIARETGENAFISQVSLGSKVSKLDVGNPETIPKGGPLWVAPSITRDSAAAHIG